MTYPPEVLLVLLTGEEHIKVTHLWCYISKNLWFNSCIYQNLDITALVTARVTPTSPPKKVQRKALWESSSLLVQLNSHFRELFLSNSAAFSCHTQGMDQTSGARRVGVHHQLCDIIGWTQPLSCTFDSGENTDISVQVYFWCLDAENRGRYNILNIIYTFLRSC